MVARTSGRWHRRCGQQASGSQGRACGSRGGVGGGAERAVRAEVLMEDGNGGEVLGHSACVKRTEGGTQGGCSGGSSMVAGAS
jgi:hypothetical protein